MTLAVGTRLGPYEIVGPLGAGGMGEVYKARDTRLDRTVAVKVLPEALAASSPALERFQREARAASALNHPNICTVHDIGEAGDGRRYLVMELLEGETLQQRLTRGPLGVSQLVDMSLALVDALAAAHRAGIVHRDIKPGNIFLTAHGPKILDFGLAKTTQAVGAAGNSDQLTLEADARLTDHGVTVGTVAYMSPEQLRGDPLDARTDLFSLGLVLYEMATGRAAFVGATRAVLAAAILHDTPRPPCQIRRELPERLQDIILTALEKDPDVRCQTAAEVRADLKRLKRQVDAHHAARSEPPANVLQTEVAASPAAASAHPPSSDAEMVAALVRRHRGGVAIGVAVVALVAAGALYFVMQRRPSRPAGSSPSLADLRVLQLTTSGNASSPAISPDGKYVAYVQGTEDASIWIRQTDTSSNVQIVPPQPFAVRPAITVTPDGSFVDFVRVERYDPQSSKSALWRVPFLGGTPKRVLDDIVSPVGWSPDGRRMAFVRGGFAQTALMLADADGSHERVLTAQRTPAPLLMTMLVFGNPLVAPAWSPDGRIIASAVMSDTGGKLAGQIVFTQVADASVQAIASPVGITGIGWLDDTSLVLSRRAEAGTFNQLWHVTYPRGEVSRLTNDLSSYGGVSLTADRATLVTARTDARTSIWVADGGGENGRETVQPFPDEATGYGTAVTWAGERLVYTTKALGLPTIESLLPGRGSAEEVVSRGVWPSATPDGQTIVFVSTDTAILGSLWAIDTDGRRKVQIAPGNVLLPVATPNRSVLFNNPGKSGGRFWLWMASLDGGEPTVVAEINALSPDVSPDGTSVAFVTDDSWIMVCDLPACTNRRRLSVSGKPRWTSDGRAVAYADQSNLWIQPLGGGSPRQLTHFADGKIIQDFAWSRDGHRLAVARTSVSNDIVLIKGLKK
jgi:serine/threonine protein kinase